MRVFLAEKPSVGREISKYLPQKGIARNGYIDHGDTIVTWAFGHMLHQAEPHDYNEKYKFWREADLPIVPKEWKLLVTKNSANQFSIIKGLLEKADEIVNAGDPDREGQLLIDEILVYLGIDKPTKRILINALDEKSMKTALSDLRNNDDFLNLRQSALARARADWLVGMNLSRAYTIAIRKKGHKLTFPIGRVKTPTLALVVRREEELKNFKPVKYYTLQGEYFNEKGTFKAAWRPSDTQAGVDHENRLLKREVAEELVKKLMANPIAKIQKCERKKRRDNQRLPLSLSELQVLAGKEFSYDPQKVLETAQSLYEKKLTTYPRSDCDYLPESQYKDAPSIIANLRKIDDEYSRDIAAKADVKIKSKAWNDKKITAHHAIIPTTVACKLTGLSKAERDIYKIIAKAYIAQFYPVHEYNQTRMELIHEGELFVASGRVVVELGWKELYSSNKQTKGDDNKDELPMLKKGETVKSKNFEISDKETKPPSRFTAATLLQAMKEIHKYVKTDDVKKQLKDVSGIGTEATRASIIDDLIRRKFIAESGKKKVLKPTKTGDLLINSLPDELSYPDATAVWEERLAMMSRGEETIDNFLEDQISFLTGLVKKVRGDRVVGAKQSNVDLANAPICEKCKKGKLIERKGKFGTFMGCTNYPNCKYTKNIASSNNGENVKTLELDEASKDYKCPRCKEGYFVKSNNSWICSNRGKCKTACADVNGKPSIFANR